MMETNPGAQCVCIWGFICRSSPPACQYNRGPTSPPRRAGERLDHPRWLPGRNWFSVNVPSSPIIFRDQTILLGLRTDGDNSSSIYVIKYVYQNLVFDYVGTLFLTIGQTLLKTIFLVSLYKDDMSLSFHVVFNFLSPWKPSGQWGGEIILDRKIHGCPLWNVAKTVWGVLWVWHEVSDAISLLALGFLRPSWFMSTTRVS